MFVIEDYIFILQTICAAGTNYVITWSVTSIQAELFDIFFTTDGKFDFIGAAGVSYSINLSLKPLFSCNGIHFICVSRNSTNELQLST